MTDLPPGWELARLDEIAEVRLGRQRSPKNHSGAQMRPYLRAANVDWDGLKLDDVKEMNFTDAEAAIYRLQPGDIILSEASGSASEVGKPAIWNGEIEDCCFQNTLIRVRSYGVDQRYLLHFLRYEALRGAFIDQTRGVGIHHLGQARLASWPSPVCPAREQREIAEVIDNYLLKIDKAKSELNQITTKLPSVTGKISFLVRSILREAYSGRLVSQDSTEEPASAMLARLRAQRSRTRPNASNNQQECLL